MDNRRKVDLVIQYFWQVLSLFFSNLLCDLYFRNRVGFISLAEIVEIFSTICILEDEETEKALEKATQVFWDIDREGDLEISKEEFIEMCRQDDGIIQTLKETHEWIWLID